VTPSWIGENGASYRVLGAGRRAQLPRAILRLAALLQRERIDVLHTHLFDAGFAGMIAGRLARTPLLALMRHHLDENALLGTRLHIELDRWMARRADYVIVPSDTVRRYMVEREALGNVPIEVVHLGFDFDALGAGSDARARVRAEFGLGDAFVIG